MAPFIPEKFEHPWEKGWNDQFRVGAIGSNVQIVNDSLQLFIDPTNPEHLVVGGSVRSQRRDMQFGSFRSYMQSPAIWAPGSALSMMVQFNETESMEFDLMNTNDPSQAWVSNLVGADFPGRDLGINYSNWGNKSGTLWEFNEYRIDWTHEEIKYSIDGNVLARPTKRTEVMSHTQGPPFARAVVPIGWVRAFFNSSTMTEEEILAFNSDCHVSDACLMDDHALRGSSDFPSETLQQFKMVEKQWKKRWVPIMMSCISLAISTLLIIHSLLRRTVVQTDKPKHDPTKGVLSPTILDESTLEPRSSADYRPMKTSSFVAIPDGVGILEQAVPPARLTPGQTTPDLQTPMVRSRANSLSILDNNGSPGYWYMPRGRNAFITENSFGTFSPSSSSPLASPTFKHGTPGLLASPSDREYFSSPTSGRRNEVILSISQSSTNPFGDDAERGSSLRTSSRESSQPRSRDGADNRSIASRVKSGRTSRSHSWSSGTRIPSGVTELRASDSTATPTVTAPASGDEITTITAKTEFNEKHPETLNEKEIPQITVNEKKQAEATTTPVVKTGGAGLPAPTKRVDYLAGLVALSSLIVTGIHYCLTFVPAAINPGAFQHSSSELWARKTIDSFFLNLIWIGPFLMTSTRFLVTGYLRTGNMGGLAEKIVGRTPRLMVPIICIVLLEYFLMDVGATNWLQYLASIT